jgi:chromosomal replication initiation ATPase DnaA
MSDNPSRSRQLALPFARDEGYDAADFCPAPSNALAREWLARPEGWTNGRLILFGPAGSGKTHLLSIWATANQAEIHDGARLRFLARTPTSPLAIDDSDIVSEPRALLHVLNAAAEAGQKVLLTARQPPARQSFKLADLASRLRASLAVEIGPPEDELLDMLLTRLAAERQLTISPSVRQFLLTHLPRTAASIREAIARLDHASLGRGIRISRALAASLLRELAEPAPDPDDLLLNRHSPPQDGLL